MKRTKQLHLALPIESVPDRELVLEAIFSVSPDAVIVVNESGKIVLSNPVTTALFGYQPDELVGEPIEILIPTDQRARHTDHLRRFFETPQSRPMGVGLKLVGRHRDGTEFAVDVGLAPIEVHGQRYVAALVRDTRERQRAEQATSLLAAIVDSSNDAIIGKNLEGVITSWNLGAEQMYGYEAREVLGRHISLIVPPDRHDELDEALQLILDNGRTEHHDTQRICKDGTLRDVSCTRSPLRDAFGAIIGTSTICRDIADRLASERERQALERRLNQSERLESMGRLAGGIAHDFNNLLAVILNYASFVSEELDDKEAARADLDQIRSAAERASEFTRQLLAFARREVCQPQAVNLNGIVSGVEQLLRRTIGEHVELVTSLVADPWLVDADPGQLEQVIVNLVVNARDAMPDGGALTIDTENVEIDEGFAETRSGLALGRYVQLRVSDTGSGMERSVLDHIFEPFFTTKPQGEGTGLGLPMVFGTVTQAGGEIEFYSEPGIGTTCRVLLPTTDRTPLIAQSLTEPRVLRGTETVLVVEDEDALREVTRRILARNGYAVLTSANGPEALALLESHEGTLDLLLTDVIMPHMLGKEVAARLQGLRPGLPVLFISGYAHGVLGSTMGDEIMLLEKPFSERTLLTKVRDILDNSARTLGR